MEQAVISAFLSVALKLSLEDFKPVYQRLVTLHQEAGSPGHLVTIFNLTTRVAEKLKSLFSFGVESTALLAVLALAEERPPLLAAAAVRAAGAGAALRLAAARPRPARRPGPPRRRHHGRH